MGGQVTTTFKYKAGKSVPLPNKNIYAMKKDQFYADILQIWIKEKKCTVNKPLKYSLKVAMQKR